MVFIHFALLFRVNGRINPGYGKKATNPEKKDGKQWQIHLQENDIHRGLMCVLARTTAKDCDRILQQNYDAYQCPKDFLPVVLWLGFELQERKKV